MREREREEKTVTGGRGGREEMSRKGRVDKEGLRLNLTDLTKYQSISKMYLQNNFTVF